MTYVKDLTGPDITGKHGVVGTDLGIARRDPDRDNHVVLMFGDTFNGPQLTGTWTSPCLLVYDEVMEPLGTPALDHAGKAIIDSEGTVQPLWAYPHNNGTFSTVLPTDFIRIGEWWWVHVMVMGPNGLKDGAVWTEWQRSRNLVDWEFVQKTEPPYRDMTMLTFDVVGDYVYIFGTHGLSRDGHIRLWSCPAEDFPNKATWEAWNGRVWSPNPADAMPIMFNNYGEINFRATEFAAILTYFDATQYRVAARTSTYGPERIGRGWETVIAEGLDYPQLYGGYLLPTSDLGRENGAQFAISQWRTIDNTVYKAGLHKATLPKLKSKRGWFPGLVV